MSAFMTVILVLTLIYFIYTSVWDILLKATPTVENMLMLLIAAGTFIFSIVEGTFVWGCVPILLAFFIILILPLFLTKRMGGGDVFAYLICMLVLTASGFVTGVNNAWLFVICWFVSNITFIFYCRITKSKRKTPESQRVPMFPFILIGYIVSMIIYFH